MFDLRNLTVNILIKAAARLSLLMFVALMSSGNPVLGAPPDTMPIWRAQVRFVTANIDDAGSDDNVKIELNAGNRTWLDSGWDDFETGTRTYDLRLDGVNLLSDIDYLRIEKTGSDGWAIRHMYLIINGVTIYHEEFAPGLWLDNDGGNSRVYFIDDFFMRPRSHWLNYVVPVRPNIVPLNDMRLRMESLLGDFATTDSRLIMARSGDYTVEPYTLNTNTWHVDMDMEVDNPAWNPDVDIDFDLTVSCLNTRPNFLVSNVVVTTTLFSAEDEAAVARSFIINDFRLRLNEMMKNFKFFRCPSIQLAPNGDLNFISILPPIFDPPGGVIGFSTRSLIPNDNTSPLSLNVITEDNIKTYAETTFTANVSSGLREDTEVNITFELPAQIALSDAVIEATNADGTRRVVPEIIRQENGTSLVILRERVAAGKATDYTLHILFQNGEARTNARIITRVEPVSEAIAAKVTPLSASTSFRFDSDAIMPEGTLVNRSTLISPNEPRR